MNSSALAADMTRRTRGRSTRSMSPGTGGPMATTRSSSVSGWYRAAFCTAKSFLPSFTTAGWLTTSQDGLNARSFAGPSGDHPYFTPFGAPMTFGYERGTLQSSIDSVHGIDNFSVTVHTAAAGAGVIAFRHRTA